MALKERNVVKFSVANSGTTLVAPNHESFRVTGVYCVPSTNDTYVTLMVDGVTILKLRAKGLAGNHIPYPAVKTGQLYEAHPPDLFAWARGMGRALDIPVAAGQTLTLSRYAEAGKVALVYDRYDAGDVKADEPNGSEAALRRYLHYLTNSAAVTADGDAALDTSLIWTGFDSWPVAARQVGANTIIRLLALLGAPGSCGNATVNKGYTTYLRLLKDGDTLMDDGVAGIPFLGDVLQITDAVVYAPICSFVGPQTAENLSPALVLPAPLEFKPGATLTPLVTVANGLSGGFVAGELDLAMFLERETTGQ